MTTTTTTAATPEHLRHIVDVAGLAPSVHNTQPWRFVATADGLELHADPQRQLTQLDPVGRQLLLSCGAALFHARVAARALGLDVRVNLVAASRGETHLADLVLTRGRDAADDEIRLATAVLHRHTHRGPFESRHVPPAVLQLLRAAAQEEGAALQVVAREDHLVALEVLLARASARQDQDDRYRAELGRWVHDDAERPDGIPADAVAVVPGSSLQQRDFTLTHSSAVDGSSPTAEHPTVMVLATVDDGPTAWLQAGQALASVLLRAADHGIQAQPLGQVTDSEADRVVLRAELGLISTPQLVLRLGYADARPLTARRAVDDVLVPVTH